MEENDLNNNANNNDPLPVIDEIPELTTLVLATKMQDDNDSLLSNKILSKLSKGYTIYTVIKVISYSINETSFILPYCLRRLGIIPFFLFLIIFGASSLYIFHLTIDLVVKYNLYENYHQIIQENTNRIYNMIYFIVSILYHFLILIVENYLYLSLCQRVIRFSGLSLDNEFVEKIIVLSVSLIFIELPFSLIKLFKRPDQLYIFFTILNFILNIIALIFVIKYRNSEQFKLIKLKMFEDISQSYFVCFSILMTVIGWQGQTPKQLESFKIKTTKRFFKVVYLFFIIQFFLIIFICFVSAPLITDKVDVIIFLLDYKNINLASILIIEIAAIAFVILIHIIIAHHMHLIYENYFLLLKKCIYKTIDKKIDDNFKINKYFSICFNLIILIVINLISLILNDISLIIIIYGGVFSTMKDFLSTSILYWCMVSKNSIVTLIGFIISFFMISIGITGIFFKIFCN